jgi:hypothetical protein
MGHFPPTTDTPSDDARPRSRPSWTVLGPDGKTLPAPGVGGHARPLPPAEALLQAVADLAGRDGVTQLGYRKERDGKTGELILTVRLVTADPPPLGDRDFDRLREAM